MMHLQETYVIYKGGNKQSNILTLMHSSHTSPSSLQFLTPIVDRDQTVSRRSKPSSRTFLNVEQTYPWFNLRNQDKMSRHRGAKRFRQLGLLRTISLLSLA